MDSSTMQIVVKDKFCDPEIFPFGKAFLLHMLVSQTLNDLNTWVMLGYVYGANRIPF